MVGGGKSVWFQFRAHYKVSLLLDSKGKTHRLVMTLPFLATAVMLERREREMHRTAQHGMNRVAKVGSLSGSTRNSQKRQYVVFVNFRDKTNVCKFSRHFMKSLQKPEASR